MWRNIKAKCTTCTDILEYKDIFDDSDKGKEPENDENETKMNTADRNTTAKMKEHVAKHERHASSCYKCNFETKTLGKLMDHVAKHKSKECFKH